MIISLRTRHHHRDEYIVCPSSSMTVETMRDLMISRAQASAGSYAYRLVDDLHSAIFMRSLDLMADYAVYFSVEYDSFEKYLRRRMGFPSAVLTTLANAYQMSSGMYHFLPAHDFLNDDFGREFLTQLMEESLSGVKK